MVMAQQLEILLHKPVQANIIADTRTNEALNRVYNIAANHQITLIEAHKIISQNISMNLPSIEVNQPIFRDFRPGDILHSEGI